MNLANEMYLLVKCPWWCTWNNLGFKWNQSWNNCVEYIRKHVWMKWMEWKPMDHEWLDHMEQWNLNLNDNLNQCTNIDTLVKPCNHEVMNVMWMKAYLIRCELGFWLGQDQNYVSTKNVKPSEKSTQVVQPSHEPQLGFPTPQSKPYGSWTSLIKN